MGSDLVRVTGMISGMDTESLISMYSSKAKNNLQKAKNNKTLNTWTQDAWKSLNSKVYSFYTGTLSANRLSTAYKKTKTTTSNSALSVVSGSNAAQGVQSAQIVSTAKSAYLTGTEIKRDNGSALKADDSLANAFSEDGGIAGASFTFKTNGGTEKKFIVDSDTFTDEDRAALKGKYGDDAVFVKNMNQLTAKLKDAGVNANYDATNQRLFINAKTTGQKADFSFTANFSGADADKNLRALSKLGLVSDTNISDYAQGRTISEDDGEGGTSQRAMTAEDVKAQFDIAKTSDKVPGSKAKLILNGAEFESDSNTFNINGNTYTINHMPTDPGENISITTSTDYDGVYDVVKKMLKEYNELVNEMSKLYNAESAKGYDPLSDEQKEEMSEKEIEDWENKIKGSLLRQDNTLYGVMSALTDTAMGGFEIGGKTMYLSDFGISTQNYFEAEANERYALHIDGDSDDEISSGKDDKLKAMIASDPEKVSQFFAKFSSTLYDSVYKKMSGNTALSSIYKVYNDKQLKEDGKNWDDKIAELEDKVTEIEDKWYSKFAAMETKLAKLQKNQTAVGGFFGG
ncbi:MAG: flagellar filament capping protein FliD [Lachnospiraceae bacterium]|nr:flagellar filament capping protein FliD [Lachnospiraceae bacterium]